MNLSSLTLVRESSPPDDPLVSDVLRHWTAVQRELRFVAAMEHLASSLDRGAR